MSRAILDKVHLIGDCPRCTGVGYDLDHGHLPDHCRAGIRPGSEHCDGSDLLADNPRPFIEDAGYHAA